VARLPGPIYDKVSLVDSEALKPGAESKDGSVGAETGVDARRSRLQSRSDPAAQGNAQRLGFECNVSLRIGSCINLVRFLFR
jgi:hypothetical protein